jgi:Tfp pilus assembly protein PilP
MRKYLISTLILMISGCAAQWDFQRKPTVKLVEPKPMENIHCLDQPQNCKCTDTK